MGHDRWLTFWRRSGRRRLDRRRLGRLFVLGALGFLSMGCSRPSAPPSVAHISQPEEAPRRSFAAEKTVARHVAAQAAVEVEPAADTSLTASRDPAAERLLLLLPAAPLLVEFHITIDGRPFRNLADDLSGELLEAADRDGDGRATWGEVFADPKRIFGPSLIRPASMSNRRQFMKANDTNRNGLVDRDEARRFLEEMNHSEAAFSLTSTSEYRQSGRSIVWKLLDADGDDLLDQAELAALEQRLLIRDANDDQTVTWSELDDSLAGDEVATARRKVAYREEPAALLLGPRADWKMASAVLTQEYLQNPSVPAGRSLLDDLGASAGQLSAEETARLDALEPQAVFSASFAKDTEPPPGLSLLRFSPQSVSQEGDASLLVTGGCRVRFVLNQQAAASDPWSSAEEQLAALDADKNGYLEKREVDGRVADAAMFEEADANFDGKIYLDELTAYRRRQQAPQLGAVYALVRYEQDFVFALLDSDQDGRLTTRELRAATRALRDVDANADGRIEPEEIPSTMLVVLGRGRPPQRPTGQPLMTSEKPADLPKWFVSMDANGDREISREEFPGSNGKFRSLDLDDDGFIVAGEARQAVP